MRAGRPWTRTQLIELLWPDDDESSARHSLSQSVSLINKVLGLEAIGTAGRDQYVLQDGVIALDVVEFGACVAGRRYEAARDLWHGNLLEGQWVQRAPQFERWLDEERQRLACDMRRVLGALVEVQRGEGAWEEMRASAEASLALDPLDEPAMLACLEALVLSGDRTLALRRYREFETRLKDELDAEPGPALRNWIKRQRKGDGAAAGETPRPLLGGRVSEMTVLPAALPVFGRHAEYAVLWEAWEAARTSAGTFIILQGEAGIGKTALASKLVTQVHVAGGSACFVRCFQSEKSVPFAPISALIRQLARLPGFVALSETWIGELTRLVPELRERYPNAPQPMAVDDSARYRLCDATLQAAACVSDEHPLLIVVDDIQDADEATLALLHYFGRQVATQPAVLLCVARQAEERTELQRVFFETARTAGFARFLELGALAEAEIGRIMEQVLAQRGLEAPDWALTKLAELSRGNPLHAGELAMAIPGSDGRPTAAWLDGLKDRTAAEGSFAATSTARLHQLSDDARHVAAVLAVAGRPLTGYELAAVTGLPVAELAASIGALEDAWFIRRSGATLGFAHEQYFLSADATVADPERRAVHLTLARHLAKSAADNPSARYEVARHYEGAGRLRDARAQALAAAKYAGSIGAVREQASALELAKKVTSGFDGALAAELASCYLALRQFADLDASHEEALRQPDLPAAIARDFDYLEIAGKYHSGGMTMTAVKHSLERLLGSQATGFAHEGDAHILLMRVADKAGQHLLARKTARLIRRAAGSGHTRGTTAHALLARAFVTTKYFWPARALQPLHESLRHAQASSDWGLEQLCRAGLGAVYRQLGRYRESIRELQFGLALARKTLDPQAEASGLMDIGNAEMARGNYDAAGARFAEAAEIDVRFPRWAIRAYRYGNNGELMLLTHDLHRATDAFQRSHELAASIELWPMSVMALGGLAMCAQRAGDVATLGHYVGELQGLRMGRERVQHERWMAEAAAAWHALLNLNDARQAVRILERAIKELSRRDVDHWLNLEMELIRLRERVGGEEQGSARQRLADTASTYEAKGILEQLAE